MEDLNALAARIAASVGELRGCLILSRDGLVLGSFPDADGALAKPAWLRFAALGEPDKGFLQFGSEIWCYARRGPYAAFAVAGLGVRAGLVIDQLEIALVQAEEARAKVEPLKVPETPAAPSSKPRAPLHPEIKAPAPEPAPIVAEPAPIVAEPAPAPTAKPQPAPKPAPAPVASEPAPDPEKEKKGAPVPGKVEDDGEIDRVLLAQEFSRLLQERGERDES